jgi:hypothetical protein
MVSAKCFLLLLKWNGFCEMLFVTLKWNGLWYFFKKRNKKKKGKKNERWRLVSHPKRWLSHPQWWLGWPGAALVTPEPLPTHGSGDAPLQGWVGVGALPKVD